MTSSRRISPVTVALALIMAVGPVANMYRWPSVAALDVTPTNTWINLTSSIRHPVSGVTPTNLWVDLYSGRSTFASAPIPTGSYVAVFDTQNTQCGQFTTTHAGCYGIMPCYGDYPGTGGDEGAVPGELLSFTINGVPATPQVITRNGTPVPPGPATWTQHGDRLQVDLWVPPRPPVTATLGTVQLRLDWLPVGADVARYEIWRATAPYFASGEAGAQMMGTVTPDGIAPLSWSDGAGVGDPELNYTYRVRSVNALSQTIGISQAVAEFDFALYQ